MRPSRRADLVLAAALASAAPAGARLEPPELVAALRAEAPALHAEVLGLALRAAACAERRGLLRAPETLTVIDYSRPSTEARLFVLDLARRRLLHQELVAHGRGSGDHLPTRFSNEAGTRMSSLGLFVTEDVYVGHHGRSLRLRGLEPGVNDRARERALVMHGADYVSPEFAARHGRLGRSWGCPALANAVAPQVIDRIRGGTPLFVYSPVPEWLERSAFLGACEGGSAP